MLAMRVILVAAGVGLLLYAAGVLLFDVYLALQYRREKAAGAPAPLEPGPVHWQRAALAAAAAVVPLLFASAIVVVPSGMGGVRVSQTSGVKHGTLYPGVHFVRPLVDDVVLFDTRDQVFTTGGLEEPGKKTEVASKLPEPLTVQSKEGLSLGLAVTVRYKLDPARLDHVQGDLPLPVERELVPPVVASAWRELAPGYTVRDIFSAKREEVRSKAAEAIRRRLEPDGILVKEVMLRDVQLPPEYAKGLETLLLKEQENDRKGVETEIQAKEVRISELRAESVKVEQVKNAEAQAEVRVLQAKAESDAMQYTLPLKQKQIEQSKLEAEARKEATVKGAEAAAQAKVIDSKAEQERRNLLAEAEANRIRVTAAADAERMKSEAAVLKQNPLLINKIVAERLSDKLQIMMVPADGKFFFANDVLRSMSVNHAAGQAEPDDSK
ncbi:MAG TPA: SPFH domain-containing protein [Terriglobales bacterium]|nr:SPFH domain-containing protein [Terriglobales bacterium]